MFGDDASCDDDDDYDDDGSGGGGERHWVNVFDVVKTLCCAFDLFYKDRRVSSRNVY